MPLSIRLQKKRSSNCLDLFSHAVTGLTDKNNSAEVDVCVRLKTLSPRQNWRKYNNAKINMAHI